MEFPLLGAKVYATYSTVFLGERLIEKMLLQIFMGGDII